MSFSRELTLPEPWFRLFGAHLVDPGHREFTSTGGQGGTIHIYFPSTNGLCLNDIPLQKKRLRREASDRRRISHTADNGEAGKAAAEHFMAAIMTEAVPGAVAAYWAVRDELATRPLLDRLSESSVVTCLPVVAQQAAPLVFRLWHPEAVMEDGVHGIPVPNSDVPETVPAIVVTPMLAFDAAGYRLGYGGGYYDRTLAALRGSGGRVLAVGFAYEEQEMDEIPHDQLDQPLDWVVTEQGARKVRR